METDRHQLKGFQMHMSAISTQRIVRIALVVLVHAALLWCAFKLQRLPYFQASGAQDPAMVWVKEPVAVLAPAPFERLAPPAASAAAAAPLAPPAPAIELDERIVIKDAVASTLALPAQDLVAVAPGGAGGTGTARGASTGSAAQAPPAARPAGADDKASIVYTVLSATTAQYTIPALTGDELHAVDRGLHKTIEIAIAQHIISQIRISYADNIQWQSMRTGAMVRLSMHKVDNDRVVEFLHYDLFGYKPL
jgi:hypothetical protein